MGQLNLDDLRRYASEHHHAVEAIAIAAKHAAGAADGAMRGALVEHAVEERDHAALWLGFARAVGWQGRNAWGFAEDPLAETVDCSQTWAGDASRGLAQHLVTLYAIESAQPRIAAAKLDGLRKHYGITRNDGTAYFRVHAKRDADHAELVRIALTRLLEDSREVELLDQVEQAYRSNWRLLDGVDAVVDADLARSAG